ncbi:unnamed protein product [Linum tenue]|uniref:DUF4219 domain-containing protein n=1 Tax=Linum tenue TaxID=586396 RepID=A0AAV0HT80_9ROSI|nr:unnamed protein product [Linum tenue]
MKKLNETNYSSWSTRMEFYLRGQKLWEIITIPPPKDEKLLEDWKQKADKIMYILAVTTEDQFLPRIKESKSPKEAWDTLSTIFARTNEARLQRLENELMSLSQETLTDHWSIFQQSKKCLCRNFETGS